jgi:ribonuclease Z
MHAPYFPISPDMFSAEIEYRDFEAGDKLTPYPRIAIRTARLSHPGGVIGYRVEYGGKASVYMTDVTSGADGIDAAAAALAADADLLIYDCTYTDEEFTGHSGYGHSTWQRGVRLCKAAGVDRLAMFHHAPDRTDPALALLERRAQSEFSGAIAARIGMTLKL